MRYSISMITLIVVALFGSACGQDPALTTPTLSVESMQTSAMSTLSFALTQTALANPTNTPTPTATVTLPVLFTSTLSGAPTFAPAGSGGAGGTGCPRASYVADVTIPDGTVMTPGQAFTKTWKISNNGSCAWDPGFKFAFTGGDNMQGLTFTLAQSVPANTEISISIDMIAPTNKTGNLRSNWRMQNAAGTSFGDELFVQITVGGSSGTAAPTNTGGAPTNTVPAASPTETATPTATAMP